MNRRRMLFVICAMLMAVYIASYMYLSRRAYARWSFDDSFYFADPSTDSGWRRHAALYALYFPLIKVDCLLGTGRDSGAQPLYELK